MSPEFEKYFAKHTPDVQERMQALYEIIKPLCKDAEERIAYGMPAFKTTENIVYFAGYKNHVGLYPTPLPIEHFAHQLTPYKTSKGAVQFPHTQKFPVALIKKIVQFRLKEIRG